MVRVWFLLGIAAAVFYIFSVVDCAMSDRDRARGLPKQGWIVAILLFPVIGGVLWFAIGRGRKDRPAPARRALAPDDDPEFLARLRREHENERRLRNLEERLAERDDTKRDGDPGPRDA